MRVNLSYVWKMRGWRPRAAIGAFAHHDVWREGVHDKLRNLVLTVARSQIAWKGT